MAPLIWANSEKVIYCHSEDLPLASNAVAFISRDPKHH